MAGNNSIQILRGNNVKSTAADEVLLDGQPLYDRTTGYLYVGENKTVASTQAVNAHYANTAGTASSATQANYVKGYLYFNGAYSNGNSYNTNWDGRDTKVLYVPTALGSTGQVWGMVNSNRAGWINQTEIPGTIENANHANTADVAYEVSGANVNGTVSNANFSNFANIANSVGHSLNIIVMGNNYTYDGGVAVNVRYRNLVASHHLTQVGAIPYANTNGTGVTPANVAWLAKGNTGQILSATASGIAWANPNTLNVNSANTANSVESNLNIRVMGTNYTYNGSSLVNIRSRNIVATNTSVDRGAIPYANTNGTTTTAANVTWLAKGDTGQALTATSTGIAWTSPSVLYYIEWGGIMAAIFSGSHGISSIQDIYNDMSSETYRQIFGFTIPNNEAGAFLTRMWTRNNRLWFGKPGESTATINIPITQSISIFPLYEFNG